MRQTVRRSWLALTLLAVPATAQTLAGTPSTGVVRPSASGAVIQPGRSVDPGMKVIRPKMPPAGTPVIKPRTMTPDGTVLVPK